MLGQQRQKIVVALDLLIEHGIQHRLFDVATCWLKKIALVPTDHFRLAGEPRTPMILGTG